MELFPAIAIIIVMLVIIIIVIVVVIVVTNQIKVSTTNNDCSNQKDCPSGYVCIHTATGTTGICKAGVGTSCNTDDDCSTNLICSSTNNSINKVCSRKNKSSQNISLPTSFDPLLQSNINSIRRRTTWTSPTIPKLHNNNSKFSENTQVKRIRVAPERFVTSPTNINSPDVCTPLSPEIEIVNITAPVPITELPQASQVSQAPLENVTINNIPALSTSKTSTMAESSIPRISGVLSERSCTPLTGMTPVDNTTDNLDTNSQSNNNIINIINPIDSANPEPLFNLPDIQAELRHPTRRVVIRKGINGDSVTPLSDIISGNKSNTARTYTTKTDIIETIPSQSTKPINNTDHNISNSINVTNQDEMIRTVIPVSKQFLQREATSLDDEQNSDGDYTDGRFDIRSGDSTKSSLDSPFGYDVNYNYGITSVSTPCEEKDGVYYCRSNKAETIQGIIGFHSDNKKIDHSPVIDVCSYSNETIFLLEDGNIICELDSHNGDIKNRYRASNNIPLIRITSFGGYLHGVGADRKLYTLPNNYFSTANWIWNLAEWAPTDIKHISSTHDSSHLWIQTSFTGLLYSAPGVISSKTPYTNLKRVYGRDINHYIDIDSSKFTAKIHPGDTLVHNVYDGALSYYDEVIAVHPSERNEYRGITIVNWRPYYIRV